MLKKTELFSIDKFQVIFHGYTYLGGKIAVILKEIILDPFRTAAFHNEYKHIPIVMI